MGNVEFEEENAFHQEQQQQIYMKKDRSFFGSKVLNKKIGRYKTGTYMLFIFSCVFIVVSAILIGRSYFTNRVIPYSELSPAIKSKFPIPVQRLYQQQP